MFGLCLGTHWRVLFVVVFLSVGLAVTPAQGAEPVEPIVGTWVNKDYALEIQVSGVNGGFIGVDNRPRATRAKPDMNGCFFPAGISSWSLTGSGLHYSGTEALYIVGSGLAGDYSDMETLILNDTCVLGFFPRKFELTLSGAEYSLTTTIVNTTIEI